MLARTARALGLAATLVAHLLLSQATPALAQPTDDDVVVARETFRAGEAAYQRGDYVTAANSFEVSHRLAPHPFTMFNAGLAWQGAKQPERAADAFHKAITLGGLGEDQLADATKRLQELRLKLGAVQIEGPSEATVVVGHVETASPPVLVHLTPGDHDVLLRHADGSEARQKATVETGKTASVRFDPPAPKPDPISDKPAPVPITPPDDDSTGLFVGGWVAVGIGVAAGGTAIGLGVAALSAKDDFEASGNTDADARSQSATLRTVTNVMWGVAGVGVVTGTILLIVGWPEGSGGGDVGLDLGPGYVGVSGRF